MRKRAIGHRELVLAIGERYKAAGKADKKAILDEFIAVTGYHRKHAIRVLRIADTKPATTPVETAELFVGCGQADQNSRP